MRPSYWLILSFVCLVEVIVYALQGEWYRVGDKFFNFLVCMYLTRAATFNMLMEAMHGCKKATLKAIMEAQALSDELEDDRDSRFKRR